MQLVNDFLEASAARTPHKVALICEGERLTYAEIDRMANRMAGALQAQGVKRGDRVVLHLPNSVALVVGIFTTLKANGVFVAVNPSTKTQKLAYLLANCRARVLVTRGRETAVIDTLLSDPPPSLQGLIFAGKRADEAAAGYDNALAFSAIQETYADTRPPRQIIDQDLACLIYTSGSTGDPKGVMSAHSNVVFAADSIITYLENRPDDIILNALPLSFDYGLYQLLMAFKFGGALVLARSFTFPAQILKLMEREKVTGFPGVPTIFAILLNMDLSKYDLSALRYLTNTAAALPPGHIRQIQEHFPWATLYSMYGLTETKRTLYLPPEQLEARPGSVGIPIPGSEAWLEDDAGNRLGPNQVGELVIRGRHVMRGYWEAPQATAQRYRPGPLPGEQICYSGDLFRTDEEGYFYFVSRKDDVIKSRGEKVAPKEVENVLYGLEGVVETAVIGVPDPILGQGIKAFVVSKRKDLTERDVLRHCRAHLEDFMVPGQIEFRDSLPKTDSGKIARRRLSE